MNKVMGLDLGSVTCGVAISDVLGMYAHPYKTIRYSGDLDELVEILKDIVRENKIITIALGDPRMMNNDIGERAQLSREFKALLESNLSLNVFLIDERLTSVAAEKQMIHQDFSRKKRKKVIDQLAAVQILQTYLDQQKFMEE